MVDPLAQSPCLSRPLIAHLLLRRCARCPACRVGQSGSIGSIRSACALYMGLQTTAQALVHYKVNCRCTRNAKEASDPPPPVHWCCCRHRRQLLTEPDGTLTGPLTEFAMTRADHLQYDGGVNLPGTAAWTQQPRLRIGGSF